MRCDHPGRGRNLRGKADIDVAGPIVDWRDEKLSQAPGRHLRGGTAVPQATSRHHA